MNFLHSFFDYLNTNCKYAVLRNYEGLPNKKTGRDIDILIKRDDFKKHKHELIAIFLRHKCGIISYYDIERTSFTLSFIDDSGLLRLLEIDFLFHCEVKSVILLQGEIILTRREYNGKVYHLNKADEFLSKYLYNAMLGYPYPEKYNTLRKEVGRSPFVINCLSETFGIDGAKFEQYSYKKVLIKCFFKNIFKNPLNQIVHTIIYFHKKLRNYFYPSGFSVGFTGPDGSGKTTVINCIVEVFKEVHNPDIHHFRPTLIGNLSDTATSIGIKMEIDRDYSNPHRGGKTSKINSLLRLFYYSIDYIIGYLIQIRKTIIATQTVIFDRYFTDIIADSRRSRIYLNTKFLYYWGKLFIPSLNYNILLTADADTILARKQELDREGIDRINSKLDYLKDKKGYYLVLNNGKPEEAVRKILTLIFDEQHRRNLKRLNVCTTPKND